MFLTPVSDTLSTAPRSFRTPLLDSLPSASLPGPRRGCHPHPISLPRQVLVAGPQRAGRTAGGSTRSGLAHSGTTNAVAAVGIMTIVTALSGTHRTPEGRSPTSAACPHANCSGGVRERAASSRLQSSEQVTSRGPRGPRCPVRPHGISLNPQHPVRPEVSPFPTH